MNKKREILYLGLLAFISLFIFSIIFYKERIIFLDPIFQLAYMIRDGGFAIQVNRFAAVISKVFPYITIRLSLPLNQIILIYSMSFVIYNAIFFLIILWWFKSYKWALGLLLYNILMVSQSFYWPGIELNQGIGFMFLYFGFLSRYKNLFTPLKFILTVVFVITIAFSHPLAFIPFIFILAYLLISIEYKEAQKSIVLSGVILIFVLIIKKVFFANWYDSGQMENLNNFTALFPNYIDLQSNINFLKYLINDYYVSGLLFIFISIYFIKNKLILKLCLMAVFIIGYLFLINVSFPNGDLNFFIESKYMLLSIFIIIPIILDIYPKIPMKYGVILLFVVIAIRLVHIYNTHTLYTARLNWVRNTIEKTEKLDDKKLILYQEDVPMDTLLLTWASSYEFWALSTIENNSSRSILIDENPNRYDSLLSKNDIFLEEWRVYQYKNMPKRYFNFSDSSTYIKLKME